MRYMGLLKADEHATAGLPPTKELLERMGKFMEQVTKAGVLIAPPSLPPNSRGARVRLSGGQLTVTDGPFTETKEPVSSYAMFDVDSLSEAVEWTTSFLHVLGQGECEIRPVYEASDLCPQA
jgi:hypothetical protein